MFNNSQDDYVKYDFINGQKAYAVAVLSAVWAGAKLPPAFINHANHIREHMIAEGTWESA